MPLISTIADWTARVTSVTRLPARSLRRLRCPFPCPRPLHVPMTIVLTHPCLLFLFALYCVCLLAVDYDHHAVQEVGSGAAKARGDVGREPEIQGHGQHLYVECTGAYSGRSFEGDLSYSEAGKGSRIKSGARTITTCFSFYHPLAVGNVCR